MSCSLLLTRELACATGSKAAVRTLLLKSLLAISFFVLAPGGLLKLLSLIFLLITLQLMVDAVLYLPYYNKFMNVYNAAANGALFWGSLVLVIHVHNPVTKLVADTQALYAGAPLFGCCIGGLVWKLYTLDRRLMNRCVRRSPAAGAACCCRRPGASPLRCLLQSPALLRS